VLVKLNLKIGDLARRTQCRAETIRYYEREGLLQPPTRTAGNYRVYGPPHIERLSFIRNCRSLDMALDEIRQLLRVRDLPRRNCDEAHRLLDEHIAHVGTRISELQDLERQLKGLRRECTSAREERECGILNGLGRRKVGGSHKKSAPHVPGAHRG
jgi:Cd(II)/Pb(II)-responsive transcriptional regulator